MKRVLFCLALAGMAGCALRSSNYVIHPAAVNAVDSRTYDALLFSVGMLNEATRQAPKTAAVLSAVDSLRRAHPIAVANWTLARAAFQAGAQAAAAQSSGFSINGTTVELLESLVEMGRLIDAGNKTVREQAGKPIDPALVAP